MSRFVVISLIGALLAVGAFYGDFNGLVKRRFNVDIVAIAGSVFNKNCIPAEKLFTKDRLANYVGEPNSPGLYLAYLGKVYDVSKGAAHYGPGGSYHFFAGKDASRAFITGDFENGLVDDVEGLELDTFEGIRNWAEFYAKDYVYKGRVVGSYYDAHGCPIQAKMDFLEQMFGKYDDKVTKSADEDQLYPPCNSEWSQEKPLTRVWCSTMSGGVKRDWSGVPRQLYVPETKSYRCACIRNEGPPSESAIIYADDDEASDETVQAARDVNHGDLKNPRIREYENCKPDAEECFLPKVD